MKFAYYEVVSDENEKEKRVKEIRESVGGNPEFYSAYIEVAPKYNAAASNRKAMRALKAAIKRGKVQRAVISSVNNLYMEEEYALHILLDFIRSGVQIALKEPENIQDEDDIFELIFTSQGEFMMTQLMVPLITFSDCYVRRVASAMFICLQDGLPDNFRYDNHEKMSFISAVERYVDEGFFLYRTDLSSWYHIPDYMAKQLCELYQTSCEIMFEGI